MPQEIERQSRFRRLQTSTLAFTYVSAGAVAIERGVTDAKRTLDDVNGATILRTEFDIRPRHMQHRAGSERVLSIQK